MKRSMLACLLVLGCSAPVPQPNDGSGGAGGAPSENGGFGGSPVEPVPHETSWTTCVIPGDCPTDCGPMNCVGKACVPIAPLPDATPCVMPGNPIPHFCRDGYCVFGCNTIADCPDMICNAETCVNHACVWMVTDGAPCVNGTMQGFCQNSGCISN